MFGRAVNLQWVIFWVLCLVNWSDFVLGQDGGDQVCPLPVDAGDCGKLCNDDSDCVQYKQKCCLNGCGSMCTEPIRGTVGSENKPGFCPLRKKEDVGSCIIQCLPKNDSYCPGDEKCCFNGCGHTCESPVSKDPLSRKDGTCPKMSGKESCNSTCMVDTQCSSDLKCCLNRGPEKCVLFSCEKPAGVNGIGKHKGGSGGSDEDKGGKKVKIWNKGQGKGSKKGKTKKGGEKNTQRKGWKKKTQRKGGQKNTQRKGWKKKTQRKGGKKNTQRKGGKKKTPRKGGKKTG